MNRNSGCRLMPGRARRPKDAGRNVKTAEQNAAQALLTALGVEDNA